MSKKFYLATVSSIFALLCYIPAQSQTTFSQIHGIFQANCTVGCHSGSSPSANLDLSGTEQEVYDALVNVDPVNPYAKDVLKNKLIAPGYPQNSYLLRKVNNGLDPTLDLTSIQEGNIMPDGQQALDRWEIELIRQWIIFGARDTGTYVNPTTLVDFYNGLGLPPVDRPRSPNDDGLEGYQVRIGPIFIEPLKEIEYFYKQAVGLPGEKEVTRIDGILNEESHHFALFDFDPTAAANFPEGLFDVDGILLVAYIHENSSLLGAWQYDRDMVLPDNSAFFWDETSVLAMNYHILNYNADSILMADAYVNIYTQDPEQGTRPIISKVDQLGSNDPYILKIPPTSGTDLFTESFFYRQPGEVWDLWSFQAHTHAMGRDYDVYLVNPDSTIGEQIYEGFYDPTYTFLTGSYDYAHPPTKTWEDPFMTVNMDYGLFIEAKFQNETNDTVTFGFTTADEMFAFYMHYLDHVEDTTQVDGIDELATAHITAYPNPMEELATINVSQTVALDNAELVMHDMMGKEVRRISGINKNAILLSRDNLPAGLYVYSISQKGSLIGTGKLMMK